MAHTFPGGTSFWRAGKMRDSATLFCGATMAVLAALLLAGFVPARAAVPVDGNGFFHLQSSQGPYVGYAPDTYNAATPIRLFVWMHGCGGDAEGDMWTIAPYATRANQSYIAISIGGRDGACWNMSTDGAKVLAAIRDVSTQFNIDPRRIFIGGYSSGGDLAYRTGFENAFLFAGILAENTDPFRDTGKSGAGLMAGAGWKLNIAHLAHLSDDVYPIDGVRANLATLTAAGFPVIKIERAGTHYDDDAGATGTNYDLRMDLLPYLDSAWVSPGAPAPALRLGTKKRLKTKSAKQTIKGTIPPSAFVLAVEVKVGKRKVDEATITNNKWTYKARLKRGRNRVTIRAIGAGNAQSRPVRMVIIRS